MCPVSVRCVWAAVQGSSRPSCWTQQKLATEAHVGVVTIQQLEAGASEPPMCDVGDYTPNIRAATETLAVRCASCLLRQEERTRRRCVVTCGGAIVRIAELAACREVESRGR